ncbi:hypothetical protein G7Z17_g4598 [Cylindrodendrum hubeiense]|uniref:2EXR domain-containing protein n=1 Tax=Cylindrodendrum hubeiense TaxID=595255 RepID=A0A9P5LCI0_9HYPO|nr:hypothetical protein G7Z17_g4598 [Cylindrodendrum hubeiense]
MSKSLTGNEGSDGSEAAQSSPGSQISDAHGDIVEIEDGSSDASSETDDAGGLLDVMAAEGEETDESDQESDQEDDASIDEEPASFSQFSQLPPELRQRVWEYFCPEIMLRSRIFDFVVAPGTARHAEFSVPTTARLWTVRDWLTLEDQTKSIRTLLSVHQESRGIALNQFPDCLSLDAGSGDAIVRFNKEKDVAVIHGLRGAEAEDVFYLSGFAEHVKNGGLAGWESSDDIDPEALVHMIQPFSILESFFFCTTSGPCRKDALAWCTSDLVNRQYIETFENAHGGGENLQFLYSWPDLVNHGDFARFQISQDFLDPVPEPFATVLRQKDVKTWPMVVFEFERGLRRYEALFNPGPDGYDSNSSDEEESGEEEEESGTDLDQYESDGIDDEEIVERYDASDDEISLDGEGVRLGGDTSEAHFSSPEPDPEPEPANRGRKRRVVEDSDDDSEADEEPVAKRARTTQVISSDSEDGDEQREERAPPKRQSRVVLSDSESDDPDQMEGTKVVKDSGADGKESASEESESGESEEESESDDDEQPAAPLSLAERLRMHREVNPIESSDDDGSDGEGSQDDDSEEDEGSDVDGRSRNQFLADMAEDEDEEEEDDQNEDGFYQLD